MSEETKIINLKFRPGNVMQSFLITGEMLLNKQFSRRKFFGRIKGQIRKEKPGTHISAVFGTGQSIEFYYREDENGDYISKSGNNNDKLYLDARECDDYLDEILKQYLTYLNGIRESINQMKDFPDSLKRKFDRLNRDINSFTD